MATIIFTDGKRKHVGYSQAADVLAVLNNEKVGTPEQIKFCESVADVEFESPVKDNKKDEIMQKILQTKYEHGFDKCVAVINRIKERTI